MPASLLLLAVNVPDMPKGDLTAEAPVDSIGDCEVVAVDGEEERPWLVVGNPKVGWSGLALDIIDYFIQSS